MKIVIVGGGMQGRVIARNLQARQEKPEVVVVDIRDGGDLPKGVTFQKGDILEPAQARAITRGADAAVLAVPSAISHEALTNLLKTGISVADVSFTPEPPLSLDSLAQETGACCIVDCGVAPGLSHLLVGAAHAELSGLDSARILVGGIPQSPPPVFRHAVYFNPHDLLSEYVRPARARHGKKDIAPAPLETQVETFLDPELGELKAFLSDGLRSLLGSYPDVAEMAELTLRWPGHLESMKALWDMGILNNAEALKAVGSTFGRRYPADDYPDVLVMVVEATRGDQKRSWRLIDRRSADESAMSRTTGFTTAAFAMVLARKQFTQAGVHPPERLGRDRQLVATIVQDLCERGVRVSETTLSCKA